MTELPLLKVAPMLALRKERVDVPEWGGAVIVRGLTGSEAFAIVALRSQSLRRVRDEARERAAERARHGEVRGSEGQGAEADPAEPIDLEFGELEAYGRHVAQLLALAVVGENGLGLYSFEEWQVASQHHPAAVRRLQLVAERLSGLDAEAVEKNSPASPS